MANSTAAHETPAQTLSFFDLPGEIRNTIYALSITVCETTRQHRVGPAVGELRKIHHREVQTPSLALTCKQTHREFADSTIPKHEIFAHLTPADRFAPLLYPGGSQCTSVTVFIHASLSTLAMERVAKTIKALTQSLQHADIHVKLVPLENDDQDAWMPGPARVAVLRHMLAMMIPRPDGRKQSLDFLRHAQESGKAALKEIGASP